MMGVTDSSETSVFLYLIIRPHIGQQIAIFRMKYLSKSDFRCQNAPSLSLLFHVTYVSGLHGHSFQRRHSSITNVGTARHQERASLCSREVSTCLSNVYTNVKCTVQDKLVTLHWNALDPLHIAGLCTM